MHVSNKVYLRIVQQGSGKDGRILKEDILRHVGQPSAPSPPIIDSPKVSVAFDKVEPIRGIRRVR